MGWIRDWIGVIFGGEKKSPPPKAEERDPFEGLNVSRTPPDADPPDTKYFLGKGRWVKKVDYKREQEKTLEAQR